MSCGVGRRRGLDLPLLWHRPVATDPIRPLGWESPYTMSVILKSKKKKKEKEKEKEGKTTTRDKEDQFTIINRYIN